MGQNSTGNKMIKQTYAPLLAIVDRLIPKSFGPFNTQIVRLDIAHFGYGEKFERVYQDFDTHEEITEWDLALDRRKRYLVVYDVKSCQRAGQPTPAQSSVEGAQVLWHGVLEALDEYDLTTQKGVDKNLWHSWFENCHMGTMSTQVSTKTSSV